MRSGVYNIINLLDGKVYVGSSVNVGNRLANHLKGLRQQKHPNILLQRAWNKHGATAFHFSLLAPCVESELLVVEQMCIDKLQSVNRKFGYNLAPTAGSALGVKWSKSSKRKRSQMLAEYFKDPANLLKMSEQMQAYCDAHPDFGLALSKAGADAKRGTTTPEETKAKMAEARRLHWANLTPEQREDREYKCGNAMRGKHLTDEHRERVAIGLSAALAKLPHEQLSARSKKAWKTRRETGNDGVGVAHTNEHCEKIAASIKATLSSWIPEQLSERSKKAWATRRQNMQEVN